MTKKILIGCVTALAIILFLALKTRKPNWFIESVKNGKYTRKIGVTIGRRDLNLITKKLNKDLKDSIDPKEIKLMNNIKEIEKIDFQEKKVIEHKNKVLCNNDINIRLSKSQNNFNNNIGKKKVFGFGYNAGNNNHKYSNFNNLITLNNNLLPKLNEHMYNIKKEKSK